MGYLFDEMQAPAPRHTWARIPDCASIARAVRGAQKIVLSRDAHLAALSVSQSTDRALLTGLDLCRWPYKNLWIEWEPNRESNQSGLSDFDQRNGRSEQEKPIPDRVGVLIECNGSDLQTGNMTWVWSHQQHGCTTGLLGGMFDFREFGNDLDQFYEQYMRAAGVRDKAVFPAEHEVFPMLKGQGLTPRKGEDPSAVVEMHRRMVVMPNRHLTQTLARMALTCSPQELERARLDAMGDICGEARFAMAVCLLLNSKSASFAPGPDLTKLNKARRRSGKRELQPFTQMEILPMRSQRRAAEAAGMSAAEIRRHLVRGHFKIRRTGIYWWSPFLRGTGPRVERTAYVATPSSEARREPRP